MQGVIALAPDGVAGLKDAALDRWVGAVTLLVVSGAAALCALAPIREARAVNPVEALAEGRTHRDRAALADHPATLQVVQTALAVMLLLSAGWWSAALRRSPRSIWLPAGGRAHHERGAAGGPRPANEWMRELIERMSALPGVEKAGAVYLRPLALGPIGQGTVFMLEGQPETPKRRGQSAAQLSGRHARLFRRDADRRHSRPRLHANDTATSPRVAVVGESAARRLWPGQKPVGKRLRPRPSSAAPAARPGGRWWALSATSAIAA